MGEHVDLSYCDLRAKEIINTFDGSRLGRIIDIIFSSGSGEVKGIVVPYCRRFFFSRNQEIFIPWKCINKIGEDVILVCLIDDGYVGSGKGGKRRRHNEMRELRSVEFDGGHKEGHGGGKSSHGGHGFDGKNYKIHTYEDDTVETHSFEGGANKNSDCEKKPSLPNCDRKCEKCMLFDCEYRWKID